MWKSTSATSVVSAEPKCAGGTGQVPDSVVGATQAQRPGCPSWKYSIFHALWLTVPNLATEERAELRLQSSWFFFFFFDCPTGVSVKSQTYWLAMVGEG